MTEHSVIRSYLKKQTTQNATAYYGHDTAKNCPSPALRKFSKEYVGYTYVPIWQINLLFCFAIASVNSQSSRGDTWVLTSLAVRTTVTNTKHVAEEATSWLKKKNTTCLVAQYSTETHCSVKSFTRFSGSERSVLPTVLPAKRMPIKCNYVLIIRTCVCTNS